MCRMRHAHKGGTAKNKATASRPSKAGSNSRPPVRSRGCVRRSAGARGWCCHWVGHQRVYSPAASYHLLPPRKRPQQPAENKESCPPVIHQQAEAGWFSLAGWLAGWLVSEHTTSCWGCFCRPPALLKQSKNGAGYACVEATMRQPRTRTTCKGVEVEG